MAVKKHVKSAPSLFFGGFTACITKTDSVFKGITFLSALESCLLLGLAPAVSTMLGDDPSTNFLLNLIDEHRAALRRPKLRSRTVEKLDLKSQSICPPNTGWIKKHQVSEIQRWKGITFCRVRGAGSDRPACHRGFVNEIQRTRVMSNTCVKLAHTLSYAA